MKYQRKYIVNGKYHGRTIITNDYGHNKDRKKA